MSDEDIRIWDESHKRKDWKMKNEDAIGLAKDFQAILRYGSG